MLHYEGIEYFIEILYDKGTPLKSFRYTQTTCM